MASLRYGSVCLGIEAASRAWEGLGWEPAWFSEIELFPSAVLAYHWPSTPNLGDMTTLPARILSGEVEAPDVLVGGTPCQSFSVAGLRRGLADPRGQLTRTFVEILDALDTVRLNAGKLPTVALWENVPGVLSDKDNAFGNFLGALVGEDCALEPPGGKWTNAGFVLGPSRQAAWRVLDAQYFGVAQRRRRVFVVVCARSGPVHPVKVLLVEPGVRRDPPSRGEAREEAAADPRRGATRGRGAGAGRPSAEPHRREQGVVGATQAEVAGTLDANYGKGPGERNGVEREVVVEHLAFNFDQYSGREVPFSPTLTQTEHKGKTLVYPAEAQWWDGGVAPTLTATNDPSRSPQSSEITAQVSAVLHARPAPVASAPTVRRLTPTECERLQGFPDGHTRIPWKGKPAEECPDGPRYKALGNSMAVPVMAWIGRRIDAVE